MSMMSPWLKEARVGLIWDLQQRIKWLERQNGLLKQRITELEAKGVAAYQVPQKDAIWCEQCTQFVPMDNPPKDYNPCKKGHIMNFFQPHNWPDDEYGFFVESCADYESANNE